MSARPSRDMIVRVAIRLVVVRAVSKFACGVEEGSGTLHGVGTWMALAFIQNALMHGGRPSITRTPIEWAAITDLPPRHLLLVILGHFLVSCQAYVRVPHLGTRGSPVPCNSEREVVGRSQKGKSLNDFNTFGHQVRPL